VGGRGESPVGGPADEALAAWVLVQVVQFLPPETLGQQRFRMSRRLPESALAIVTRGLAQHVVETRREMFRTVVAQLPPGELPKVRQDRRQGRRIEIPVKDDGVQMLCEALNYVKLGGSPL